MPTPDRETHAPAPIPIGGSVWPIRGGSMRAIVDTKKEVTSTATAFVEVRSGSNDARFELELGNGRRIRVPASFDPKALEQLLAVLDRG